MFLSSEHSIYYEYVTGEKQTSEYLRRNSDVWFKMIQDSSHRSHTSRLKAFWARKFGLSNTIPRILKNANASENKNKNGKKKHITFVEPHRLPRVGSWESPVRSPVNISRGTQTPTQSPLRTKREPSREPSRESSREPSPEPGPSHRYPEPIKIRLDKTKFRRYISADRLTSDAATCTTIADRIASQIAKNPQKHLLLARLALAVPINSKTGLPYVRPRSKSLEAYKNHPSYSSPPSPAPFGPGESRHPSVTYVFRETYEFEDLSSASDDDSTIDLVSKFRNLFTNQKDFDNFRNRLCTSEPYNINSLTDYSYYQQAFNSNSIRTGHTMNPLEDHERKVIIEFCHLLEKSKQLFNGLRELPQYGHKQWHSYFGRTFDVYTKLWKFQQQHRLVLDNKYGLKRWQIGEIASKIGQLYYHFYLRTSETGYLSEAFSFYSAIRGRSYYTQASKSDKCELMVKKLRYYARFIVVCLLLKKLALVRELIKELDKQIIEYGATYDPDDQIEWTVVMDEVKAFIVAEAAVTVLHPDNYPIVLSHRLNIMSVPPPERPSVATLKLQEAVIVGSVSQQVKFSELTMDMYRILQTLEWEPTGEMPQVYNESPRYRYASAPLINKGYNHDGIIRNENPHKYLLFKPSAAQVLVYLASGCYDLPNNGALLLYISADALIVPASKITEDTGYDVGGLMTNVKSDLHRERERERDRERARERGRDRERERDRDRERDRERDRDRVWERERDRERELDCDRERDRERNRERNRERERDRERDQDREQDGERGERDREDASREPRPTQSRSKDPQCIHPGDLYPFTRCPLFIIVDSDNSYIFQNIPRHFAQPLIVLMSPLEVPNTFPPDYRKEGSLFTLFLHSPLSAFCYCCDIKTVPLVQWERSQTYIEAFNIEAAQVMLRHRIDTAFISFMSDDFLRLLLLRFMFCAVALRMHRGFRSRNQLPRSSPPLPDDLLEHPTLVHIVMDLAVHLQVRSHFHDSSGPPTSN